MAEYRSSAFRAFERTESLRTTIPHVVAGMLGLEPGSEIVWVVEPGSVKAVVSKGEAPKKAAPGTASRRSKGK